MNLLLKMGIVPIFSVPLIAGWAGTQEEAKVVEQPPVKNAQAGSSASGLVSKPDLGLQQFLGEFLDSY